MVDPCVGKILEEGWGPTPLFSSQKSHGQEEADRLWALEWQGAGHDWKQLSTHRQTDPGTAC